MCRYLPAPASLVSAWDREDVSREMISIIVAIANVHWHGDVQDQR